MSGRQPEEAGWRLSMCKCLLPRCVCVVFSRAQFFNTEEEQPSGEHVSIMVTLLIHPCARENGACAQEGGEELTPQKIRNESTCTPQKYASSKTHLA